MLHMYTYVVYCSIITGILESIGLFSPIETHSMCRRGIGREMNKMRTRVASWECHDAIRWAPGRLHRLRFPLGVWTTIFPIYFPYISHIFPIYLPYIYHVCPLSLPTINFWYPQELYPHSNFPGGPAPDVWWQKLSRTSSCLFTFQLHSHCVQLS